MMTTHLHIALLLTITISLISADGPLRGEDHRSINLKSSRDEEKLLGATHIFKEGIASLSSREDITGRSSVQQDYVHDVIFVIHQKNMEQLTSILHDVSNPRSANYGHHITRKDVADMTSNMEACDSVTSYLAAHGAVITSKSLNCEYITASAMISVWEESFDTKFFTYHMAQRNDDVYKLVRAEKYSIPHELSQHVDSVFNTVQMPLQGNGVVTTPIKAEKTANGHMNTEGADSSALITPAKLKAAYKMGTSQGNSASTQTIYGTIKQYFSPSDLAQFQKSMGIPNQVLSFSVGNHTSDIECVKNSDSCAEANLDVQYIMAVSPQSPTSYIYSDLLHLSSWLISVANMASPPLVISISYGAEESYVTAAEMEAFSSEAIKMGTMGVTIVVASGDDGALSKNVGTVGLTACAYAPFFPASNPYVVSVGATAGIESGTAEVVCQGDAGHVITSGGGFSKYYPRPSYQEEAVNGYFTQASVAKTTPVAGFGGGRGYPDISLAGFGYKVVIGGDFYAVSGTSASAPAVAGMFSNINAARIAAGKSSIGWPHPVLYSNYTQYTNDITSGNNKCARTGRCCAEGFTATAGWDPTTGLGSIDYSRLQTTYVALGALVEGILYRPTPAPTSAPTSLSAVSFAQSLVPTGSSFSTMSALIIAVVGATFLLILFIILYCRCNSYARQSRRLRDDIPAPSPVFERQDQRAVIGVLGAPNRPYPPSAAPTRPPAPTPSAPVRLPTRPPAPAPTTPVRALTLTPSAPARPAASVRPPARIPVAIAAK